MISPNSESLSARDTREAEAKGGKGDEKEQRREEKRREARE